MGYCPNCGESVEALCDESPGLSQQEKAILQLSNRVLELEKKVKKLNDGHDKKI